MCHTTSRQSAALGAGRPAETAAEGSTCAFFSAASISSSNASEVLPRQAEGEPDSSSSGRSLMGSFIRAAWRACAAAGSSRAPAARGTTRGAHLRRSAGALAARNAGLEKKETRVGSAHEEEGRKIPRVHVNTTHPDSLDVAKGARPVCPWTKRRSLPSY